MKIYEVVSGGTKQNSPPGGEDWSVLVHAKNPKEAADIAWEETQQGRPWVVYEWGTSNLENNKTRILRGMFDSYPAGDAGWLAYYPNQNYTEFSLEDEH